MALVENGVQTQKVVVWRCGWCFSRGRTTYNLDGVTRCAACGGDPREEGTVEDQIPLSFPSEPERDHSGAEKRRDLPRVAYTISPEGKLHPLIFGRGLSGVLEAQVEPMPNMVGGSHVLTMRVLLKDGDPVPWDVLQRITDAELREGRWLDVSEGRAELPPGGALPS